MEYIHLTFSTVSCFPFSSHNLISVCSQNWRKHCHCLRQRFYSFGSASSKRPSMVCNLGPICFSSMLYIKYIVSNDVWIMFISSWFSTQVYHANKSWPAGSLEMYSWVCIIQSLITVICDSALLKLLKVFIINTTSAWINISCSL